MARVQVTDIALRNGRPLANSAVTIVVHANSEGSPIMYSSEFGAGTIASLATNTNGIFQVWLEEGRYDFTVAGETQTYEVVSQRVGQVVNIRNHVTAETDSTHRTFDLGAAMEQVEASGLPLYVPQDGYKYVPLAKSITMNKSNAIAGTSDAGFRYSIIGAGTIQLPPGMVSGDALLLRNITSSGAQIASNFGEHPRVVMQDVRVVGGASPEGTFFSSYESSTVMDRVRFEQLLCGARIDGYSDDNYINVYASGMTSGSWVINKVGPGDGGTYRGFFYSCAGLNLQSTLGAQVEALVGGWHRFYRSDLAINSIHYEGDAPGAGQSTEPLILCMKSTLDIQEGVLWTNTARVAAILINDETTSEMHSSVTIGKEMYFRQRLDDPGSTDGDRLGAAVCISKPSKLTTVAFRGGVTQRVFRQDATGSAVGYVDLAPVIITPNESAEEKALQTAITAQSLAAATDSEIRRRNGVWEFTPPDPLSALRTSRRMSTNGGQPSVAASSSALTPLGSGWSSLTPATYFYQVWTVDPEGGVTVPAAEVSAVITAGKAPKLTIDTFISPVKVIIKRGTASGVYTAVAELNLARGIVEVWDQGDAICGVPWSESGLPAAPTVNTTFDGVTYRGAGPMTIFAASVPISGTWTLGTRVLTPTSEYVCVEAGTPGIWAQVEQGFLRGIVRNLDPELAVTASTIPTAARIYWNRLKAGGEIGNTGIQVIKASGNLCIAYAHNVGIGRAAAPGEVVSTTGSFACPVSTATNMTGGANGDHEQALNNKVIMVAGDWVGIAADNGTLELRCSTASGAVDTVHAAGSAYRETIAAGSPVIPTVRAALVPHVSKNWLITGF